MRECGSVIVATIGNLDLSSYKYLYFRVANLQRRDEGVWKCNRGDHGEHGSVSTKLEIESK